MEYLVKSLPLESIRADPRAQARAGCNEDTIAEYRDALLRGEIFPPIVVFFDGKDCWIGDGFHRFRAAVAAGREEILVEVRQGGLREARFHAAAANVTHGLPRTNDDKRLSVQLMLKDREWRRWSDHQIALHCGVSQPFAGKVRAELSNNGFLSPVRFQSKFR